MPSKFLPIFHVSSKAYGHEADEVAKALAGRFTSIRFGVSSEGSAKTKEFAPVHEHLANSYPPANKSAVASAPTDKPPTTPATPTE